MQEKHIDGLAVAVAIIFTFSTFASITEAKGPYQPKIDPSDFSRVVNNPYYPLVPGTTMIFDEKDGDETRLRILFYLAQHSEGLIGLSACLNGEVSRALEVEDWDLARSVAGEYRDILGKDRFFLELQDHGLPEQRALNEKLLRLAPETGLPLVVTNDLHYVHEAQSAAQDVLLCIGTGNNIDTPGRMKFAGSDFWLKSAAQMAAVGSPCASSRAIAT